MRNVEETTIYRKVRSWEKGKRNRSWGDKRVYTFPKGISPNVNIIVWPEFELFYYCLVH